jgi:hypothetical protein
MSEYLLPLSEVARLLDLSEKRIYQLDNDLDPMKVKRGTKGKMLTRWYSPAKVEEYRLKHPKAGASTTAGPTVDHVARAAAARHLNHLADSAPFFLGASPADTDRVRDKIRALAKKLTKETT